MFWESVLGLYAELEFGGVVIESYSATRDLAMTNELWIIFRFTDRA
jgi:hypothetical protein